MNRTTICLTSPKFKSSGSHTCVLPVKGKASCRPIENITRQKPYDTLFFKRVASSTGGSKAKRTKRVKLKIRFSSSAPDGCSSSQMVPEKFARLTQMPKTLFDRKLHATREKTIHAQKLGLPRSRSAQSLKGLLDRPRQLPCAWKPRLSKKTSTVSLPRVSKVLLIVDHYDNRTESFHEVSAISRHAAITFLRRDFSQLDSMKPVPTWPAVTTTRIVRSMSACFRQTLQPGSSNDGDLIESPNDNEKICCLNMGT